MRFGLALASAILLASPSSAAAYQRQSVEGAPDVGLVWAERDIAIELASTSSIDVPPTELRSALRRSLATWSAPSCSDVVLTDVGEALGLSTNLVDGHADGLNRVVVRESGWPDDVGPETLALTTLVYDRTTGRILDADVDLNGQVHTFGAGDPAAPEADDVENTFTHELGHLLGFAHVTDPDATMFGSAVVGETSKRDLGADDLSALCETYPAGRQTPPIVARTMPTSGCDVSTTRRFAWSWLTVPALLIARAGARSRRRARAAGTAS